MHSIQKVDYLKTRLNIMGYGQSSTDAEIKEGLMHLEHIRGNLKSIYKRTEKRFLLLQSSYEQGELARSAIEDYSRTLLEDSSQSSQSVGKYCNAMASASAAFESKQIPFYRNMRNNFCLEIKRFVKGQLRDARYAHVEYEKIKNRNCQEANNLRQKVLLSMNDCIKYYHENIGKVFSNYALIQREYFCAMAEEMNEICAKIGYEPIGPKVQRNPIENHPQPPPPQQQQQQQQQLHQQQLSSSPSSQSQPAFVHTVSVKLGTFPVFGVALAALPSHGLYALSNAAKAIVYSGVNCPFIFKEKWRKERISELKAMLSRREPVFLEKELMIDVAGFIITFLKELPESILTMSLYDDWLRCGEEYPRMSSCISDIIMTANRLPIENKSVLQLIIGTLSVVKDYSSVNQMDSQALALAVSSAFIPNKEGISGMLQSEHSTRFVTLISRMIENAEEIFPNCKSKCFTGEPPFASSIPDPPVESKKPFLSSARDGDFASMLSTSPQNSSLRNSYGNIQMGARGSVSGNSQNTNVGSKMPQTQQTDNRRGLLLGGARNRCFSANVDI